MNNLKDFLKKKEEKESSIRNKKIKKLNMSKEVHCKDKVETNCCDSDNLSKACNSSGT